MNQTQHLTNTNIELHRKAFHHLNHIQPNATVICEQGTLWLTKQNDGKDYILTSGQRLVIDKDSDILIEALSDVNLSIIHPN